MSIIWAELQFIQTLNVLYTEIPFTTEKFSKEEIFSSETTIYEVLFCPLNY